MGRAQRDCVRTSSWAMVSSVSLKYASDGLSRTTQWKYTCKVSRQKHQCKNYLLSLSPADGCSRSQGKTC